MFCGWHSLSIDHKHRVLPGVFIEGISVGKTADEARALIEKNPQYAIPDTLTLTVADHIFSTLPHLCR